VFGFGEPRFLLALDFPRARAPFGFDPPLRLVPVLLSALLSSPPDRGCERACAAPQPELAGAATKTIRQKQARRRSSQAHLAIVNAVSSRIDDDL